MRKAVILVSVVLLIAVVAVGQATPQVQNVPAKYTSPASGKDMFDAYCASCHGTSGKGDGPAAPAMKSPLPDLTTLAKSHGGTFPALQVNQSIVGEGNLAAHGSKDMPVWGPVFSRMSRQSAGEIQQRLHNLTRYIESLQVK
jgi:mono/diheme cytochrome c family protein